MSPPLYGRNFLTTHHFNDSEIHTILDLALKMKLSRQTEKYTSVLKNKSFLMLFYNPSVRTRISFETALTELGGHAQYMTPFMGRFLTPEKAGENIEDVAKVMSRYVAGIGLRIEDAGSGYGAAHDTLKEYAKWSDVPIINMADDRFHPCQGLADIMGWAEWHGDGYGKPNYEQLKGKTLFLTWASGALHRSKTSPHAALLMASRLGMNIKIAQPKGYSLDPEVMQWVKQNTDKNNASLGFINNPDEGYEETHVIYSRNWISDEAYQNGQLQKQIEIDKAMKQSEWILTPEKMSRTENALFTHPMPVDRNHEVIDEIASGSRSAIYDIAENRLHIQKAILALTMGNIKL